MEAIAIDPLTEDLYLEALDLDREAVMWEGFGNERRALRCREKAMSLRQQGDNRLDATI